MAFRNFYSDYQRPILGMASVIGMVLLWEFAFTYIIPLNPFFFTKPSLIAAAFKEQVVSGSLWHDIAVSSKAFLLGFWPGGGRRYSPRRLHRLEAQSRVHARSLSHRPLC